MEKIIISCFKKIFKISKLPKDLNKISMKNFKAWDSLGHIRLLLEIEKKFKTKFSMKEISELTSLKKIISRLRKN